MKKNLQSPEKQTGFEDLAVICLSDWGSNSSKVSQIIEKEVMKKGYSLSNNDNVPPPQSFIGSIIQSGKKKLHSSINPKDKVAKLLECLMENDMKHSFLQDDMGCITAISFFDPVLAPTPMCSVHF